MQCCEAHLYAFWMATGLGSSGRALAAQRCTDAVKKAKSASQTGTLTASYVQIRTSLGPIRPEPGLGA